MATKPAQAAWRLRLERTLLNSWSRRGLLACLLWPLSLVFLCLVKLRRQLFRLGVFKVHHADAVVIVVGNVLAGGAGKTPTVISIVHHLRAQGHRVGVISRGYGRDNQDCVEVGADSRVHEVGDEPLLLYRSTQVPVMVGRDRRHAVSTLLANHRDIQIIICDDGLQHYGLYRDLEICVFDDRGCGNGWVLPAGPLREPWPRTALRQAGQAADRLLVLHTGGHPAFSGYSAKRSLSTRAVRQDGTTVALDRLHAVSTKPLRAIAGIAQPENFFSMLRAIGVPLADTVALPDHYDFDSCLRNIHEGYQLICTEKDAMKLWPIAPDAVAVPLIQTAESAFFLALDACVAKRLSATLSSKHGHKTT